MKTRISRQGAKPKCRCRICLYTKNTLVTTPVFYCIFKFHFITLHSVLVVYCGAPVLRMRGAQWRSIYSWTGSVLASAYSRRGTARPILSSRDFRQASSVLQPNTTTTKTTTTAAAAAATRLTTEPADGTAVGGRHTELQVAVAIPDNLNSQRWLESDDVIRRWRKRLLLKAVTTTHGIRVRQPHQLSDQPINQSITQSINLLINQLE